MPTPAPRLRYGGDYNPEQWDESVWKDDVRLMQEAGVNLVTLGVFAWSRLEPAPGEFDLGWLDRVMDLLRDHDVDVDLATATASPPPWLTTRHPDALARTADGTTQWPGSRQHHCPNSRVYREAAARLVRRLAERYRDHAALVLWHVNNEYGGNFAGCYCDTCAAAFREWLRERYGDLDALNVAWGTSFWSQRYGEWEEVLPPRTAPYLRNPGQQLDYRRFTSDALLTSFRMERDILREVTPAVPVTTNFMAFHEPLDYWRWAKEEDVVSHDSYPDPADPDAPADAAMTYDLVRSLGGGRPWLLMEQVTTRTNWLTRNVAKRPGQMRLWSYQAVARGSDGALFFQWRASRAGAEKFFGAMVPHAGTETRVWREVVELGRELERLAPVVGATTPADVAVVFDWESWWALELPGKPAGDLRMLDQVRAYYRPLFTANVAADFVPPLGDLDGYKVLLVPNLYLTRQGVDAWLERFVAAGGTLVMSFFSGIVDECDRVHLGGYPAPFRSVLGLRVEDFTPLALGATAMAETTDGVTFPCSLWSDVIDLEGAEPVATYHEGPLAGRPAVTRHRFGDGSAYYLGTRPDPGFLGPLLLRVCTEAGVVATGEAPAGVELARRTRDGRSFLFALNHGHEPVTLDVAGRPLLAEEADGTTVTIGPFGVAVIEEDRQADEEGAR